MQGRMVGKTYERLAVNGFLGFPICAIRIRAGGAGRGPSKKKSGRPAWRAGPKCGKILKNQGITIWE